MSRPPPTSLWIALAVLVLGFALHAALAASYGWPVPKVHDEFAYLLMGDTFASGRVTNPPHPMWTHLETFHVLGAPTYQGKYPPGQGAFLALGQLLGGHPAVGVHLSTALALGALAWMLVALVPMRWAAVGCAAFALHYPVLHWWGQSYWGGSVAMFGGALLFGGMARLRSGPVAGPAWAMALGLFVLANSRPQEGALAGLLAVVPLIAILRERRAREPEVPVLRRAAVPLACGCIAVAAWTLYYNWRVTGDPLLMPHFAWPAADAVRPEIRDYQGSYERGLASKLFFQLRTFVGLVLAPALPFLALRLRSGAVRAALWVVGGSFAIGVLASRAWPHYFAPVAAPVVYLLVESLRGLTSWSPLAGRPVGRVAAVGLLVVHLGCGVQYAIGYARSGRGDEWRHHRAAIVEDLEATPGAHLVLVRYPPDWSFHEEWVHNLADVDGSKVVWALDRGPRENVPLLEYFADRHLWIVDTAEAVPVARPGGPGRDLRAEGPGADAGPPSRDD